MFETGVIELMRVNHGARSGGILGYIFDFLFYEGMLYVLIRIASIILNLQL